MKDYASIILNSDADKGAQKPQKDYASMLLGQGPDPKVVGLQGQDTTTPNLDKMSIENSGSNIGTASFESRYGANVVDDPQLKLKIYADDLMPGVEDRYERMGYIDGQYVYLNPADNKIYQASTRTGMQWLSDFGANVAAKAPSVVGGAAGSVFGPLGSGAGSGAGRYVEKKIAENVYGQEPDPKQTATDVVFESMLGTSSDIGGRMLARALAGRRAAKVAADPDLTLTTNEGSEMLRRSAQDDFGLTLLPHEATKNPYMTTRFRFAREASPESGMIADDFLSQRRPQEIDNSVDKLSTKLGLRTDKDSLVKTDAYNRAIKARQGMVDAREAASSRFYNQASQYNITDDEFIDVWERISKELSDVATDTKKGKTLRSIENKFFEDGAPVLNVGKLHNIKEELDAFLATDAMATADKTLKRKILNIQKDLTDTLKKSNPLYRRGYNAFVDKSAPIDTFDKTLAGKIANAKSEKDVVKTIFSSGRDDVMRAKKYFDDETWNGIIRGHIVDTFDNIKGLASSKGFKFRDALFGSEKQRKALAAALGDERYRVLNGYMAILDRMRLSAGGDSRTFFFAQQSGDMVNEAAGRTMSGKAANLSGRVVTPLDAVKGIADEKKTKIWKDFAVDYVNAVLDQNPKHALQNLKRLQYSRPGTEKWFAALSTGSGISMAKLSGLFEQLQEEKPPTEGQ